MRQKPYATEIGRNRRPGPNGCRVGESISVTPTPGRGISQLSVLDPNRATGKQPNLYLCNFIELPVCCYDFDTNQVVATESFNIRLIHLAPRDSTTSDRLLGVGLITVVGVALLSARTSLIIRCRGSCGGLVGCREIFRVC